MAEIADGIRIVEPVQEHFESYQKACEKMRAYLSDETINDPVGKRESKGFIFAMDSFRVGSQEEFTAKIVDFYKNKRECEATGQPLNRRNGPELFYFVVKGDVILCGYGFTAEPDYLYQINRNTGEVIDRLSLKKAPDLIVEQDGKLYVHTYSYNYVIGMDVPNEF